MIKSKLLNKNEIVLVDDDPTEALIFESFLNKSSITNSFKSLTSGVALLEYLQDLASRNEPLPAIILLDINMPMMTGHECLKRIRENHEYSPNLCIIMYSNSTYPEDKLIAEENGADDYLVKPREKKEFMEFFEALLRKP